MKGYDRLYTSVKVKRRYSVAALSV